MISTARLEFNRYFFLTRPYSWISVAFALFLADVLANGTVIPQNLLIDFIFSTALWISMNLFAEKVSGDMDSRGKINILVPSFFLLISIFIGLSLAGILVIPFILFIILAMVIYSKKNKFVFVGVFSFFIRGFMELSLFLGGLFLYNFQFGGNTWIFLAVSIYLITCGRNLIGDLRDIKFDKNTLPKKIGAWPSKIVVMLLYLIPILIIPELIFLGLVVVILIFISKDSYNLHRFLVFFNPLFCFFLSMVILGYIDLTLVTILLIGLALNFLYNFVPRESNQWRKIIWNKLI